MTRTALVNGSIFFEGGFSDDLAVVMEGERILSVVPAGSAPRDATRHDLGGARLLPGFIDIQINGGGGILFNDAPAVEAIRRIGAVHRRFGTTGFLPTLISDDLDVVVAALQAVDEAIVAGVPGLLGIHIEGPFLSTDRKGVHDPSKFLDLKEKHLKLLTPLKNGVTLITVAPERTTPDIVAKLRESGMIVSLGHTDATYRQTRAALDSGATGFTHLFNAMSPLSAREPGVIGAALEDQQSWCGIIVDGRHVARAALNIAFRAKPLEKFMLVTDAMPTVGMKEKIFTLQGRKITVKDGVCITEEGTLAGSDLEMTRAVKNCAAFENVGLAQAIKMASANPAAFLGLDRELGRIAAGYRANLIAVDKDLNVLESWIDGEPAYGSADGGAALAAGG
ncbi:MAG: N-acetylglucosamine-6-phosphate deacetylase [Pseudomonadota bacterium]|nr:N-acetylglucosamine-6-phosphate deacetylase [Pseudomonadota bacterium]